VILKPKKIKVIINIDEFVESLPSEDKLSLFRIVQEAFQNIVKHAFATEVIFKLTKQGNRLSLSIKDNGVGFDLEKIKKKKGKGIGQMLIKERVLSLGGSLNVESVLDKGTEITVSIPVEK
jgi:two-component system sensor histidine kinase DegS